MVELETIRRSNSALSSAPARLVCLFIGATRGIGASTLEELTRSLNAPKIYFVGRSKAKASIQLARLSTLNSDAVIEFIESEISILRNVDSVCEEVSLKETRLDLLFMSPGMLAFGGPHYTSEGIKLCASLSFYARMRFTLNLIPLLRNSRAPRVLSVLAGGNERHIITHDLGLNHNYSIVNTVNHTTTMHTLAFEFIAQDNPSISFLHAYPGWVQTDILDNFFSYEPRAWYGFVFRLLRAVAAVGMKFVAISAEEAGERQVFFATSSRYPCRETLLSRPESMVLYNLEDCSVPENGVYRVGWQGNGVSNNEVLGKYRDSGLPGKIWEHTLDVFREALDGKKIRED
ncbi:hypothetical protein VTL71DRAFT_12406 [Oculimacula yallundae]|uniref:NAD(P)-binding protein n=1 Tax=Oculimacula yallundae TaxID=86028 RepID=A0ABR4CMH1_9HELO